ncbi:MAG: tripartite tricarboxylate transporter TctB family protein [Comamonadaceae bacterium]|nr:MAG: tripartite tricarboxylate transporter TctB family protein [Comamonadaceae bacterium]
MFERGLNIVWCLLGLGTMVNAWSLGLLGPTGPESGLFPMICGVIIVTCGLTLLLRGAALRVADPAWPRGPQLWRVLGVTAGLVSMAATLPYLGFAISSAITTFVLLQTVERSRLLESTVLTVVSVALVIYVFGHLLGLTLPRGPWGF